MLIDLCNLKSHFVNFDKLLPVLLVSGTDDPVGNYGKGVKEVAANYRKAGVRRVLLKLYKGARHEILNDISKETVYADILGFIAGLDKFSIKSLNIYKYLLWRIYTMKDGFIKVAAAKTEIKVAEVDFNKKEIINCIENAHKNGVNLLVLPELCVSSASCGDIFLSATLNEACLLAIKEIAEFTKGLPICVVLGAPVSYKAKLFNTAVVIQNGEILGVVPKKNTQNTVFCSGSFIKNGSLLNLFGKETPFGNDIIFANTNIGSFSFAVKVGSDIFNTEPPFASVIVNPSADPETASSFDLIKEKIAALSAIKKCAIIYSNAADTESTTDYVFGGGSIIAENFKVLACAKPFEENETTSEIDTELISALNKDESLCEEIKARTVFFEQGVKNTPLSRCFSKNPFIPFYQTEE